MGKVNMKINLYKITQTLQYLKRKKNIYNVTKTLTLKKSDLSIEQFGFQQDLQSITKKKELNNYLRGTPQNRLQLRKGK